MSLRNRILGVVVMVAVAAAPLMGTACKPEMQQMSMMPESDHEDCGVQMTNADGCCLQGTVSRQPASALTEKFAFKVGFLTPVGLPALDPIQVFASADFTPTPQISGRTPPVTQLRI